MPGAGAGRRPGVIAPARDACRSELSGCTAEQIRTGEIVDVAFLAQHG